MKRTLAFDQSSKVTGYAVYDNQNLVTFGHFSIPANKIIQERLETFIYKIDVLIQKYHPEKVYFEGIQYQSNAETYKKLAMIQAMLLYKSAQDKIPIQELTPSH